MLRSVTGSLLLPSLASVSGSAGAANLTGGVRPIGSRPEVCGDRKPSWISAETLVP